MKNHILKIKILLLLVFVSISIKAEVPSWLIGKWTDGNAIIEITSDNKMRIYENDILTKEGSFTYDHSGVIETKWDKDLKPEDEYFLCFNSNPNWLAHEGGDHLTQLPDNIETNNNDNQEKDYSGELNSNVFIKYPQRCWKNISWVYGEWKIPANHPSGKTYSVKITPFYYQETTEKKDSITDFSELSKKWYKVMEGEHNLLGNIIFIDDLYFDLGAKRIYLSNLDKKIYLEQTAEYTTTTVKIIFWIIVSFIGLVILWGLFILGRTIIRFSTSSVKKITLWTKRLWNKIHSKAIFTVEKSKAQWEESIKPISSSALNQISEEIKVKVSEVKDKTELLSTSGKSLVEKIKQSNETLTQESGNKNSSSINKKKLMKGFKIAMLIGSLFGITDAVADDIDISDDTNEIDIDGDGDVDGVASDIDGDGDIDGIAVDSNGDGQLDTFSVDCNNDGILDSIATDSNGDGIIDKVAYDTNGDGQFDEIEMDTNGDGVIDTVGIDTDGDGSIDTIVENDNSNGQVHNEGHNMEENFHNAQNRIAEIDRQIMNTPDPIQRAELLREREFIMSHAPSPVDIIQNNMH